jgi:hypothetical protein
MLFVIDSLEMLDNPDWHPIICPTCGIDFIITDEFRCFIPDEPTIVSAETQNELLAMKTVVAVMGVWRTKKPEAN